jgi:hypothetical protein
LNFNEILSLTQPPTKIDLCFMMTLPDLLW